MSNITTIIFDCYRVLCTPPLFSWTSKYIGEDFVYTDELLDAIIRFDLGEIDEEAMAVLLSKYEGKGKTPDEMKEEIAREAYILEEALSIAKRLKEKGFKIGLLSNGNSEFFERKIFPERPDFKNVFDNIVVSSDVHMVKPDPAIFLHALKDIDSKPEETIFIDDSFPNIEAAIALGIHGILYTTPEKLIEDLKEHSIFL